VVDTRYAVSKPVASRMFNAGWLSCCGRCDVDGRARLHRSSLNKRHITTSYRWSLAVDKKYTMRTCSKPARGTPSEVDGRENCYENLEFIPEYCATTCYCKTEKCNNFAAPRLSKDGEKKIGQSSCPATWPSAALIGLPMTVFVINIWWSTT